MEEYQIYPLNTGITPTDKKGVMFHPAVHRYIDCDGVYMNPVICYLVIGKKLKLLVDTGLPEDAKCKKHFADCTQGEGQSVLEQLSRLGISPDDINAVVFTHLHWDHCGYAAAFRNAKFYSQRIEYEMAEHPLPMYELIYEGPHSGLVPSIRGIKMELLDGEFELCDGIRIYPSYGHSIGHQSVAINTKAGVYHCCGDLCFSTDNLKAIPGTQYPVTPPARYESLNNIWQSLNYLKSVAEPDHVLPCHEHYFADKFNGSFVIGV